MATISVLYPPTLANQDDPGTHVVSRIAGASITAGQAVYDDSTGLAQVADASVSGKQQISGLLVAQNTASGLACAIVRRGLVAGYDLAGASVAPGALIYLDVTGTLATVANGTKTVPVGKAVPTSRRDASGTILLLLDVFINPLIIY